MEQSPRSCKTLDYCEHNTLAWDVRIFGALRFEADEKRIMEVRLYKHCLHSSRTIHVRKHHRLIFTGSEAELMLSTQNLWTPRTPVLLIPSRYTLSTFRLSLLLSALLLWWCCWIGMPVPKPPPLLRQQHFSVHFYLHCIFLQLLKVSQ